MKNNRAELTWKKLLKKNTFIKLVIYYRVKFSIPLMGFQTKKDAESWLKMLNRNKTNRKASDEILFVISTYDFGFNIEGMLGVIFEYIQFGKVNENTLFNANTTGCSIFIVTNTNSSKITKHLTEGVYIKIEPTARQIDIELFIKQKKNNIEEAQSIFIKNKKILQVKIRDRESKYEYRNSLIYYLSQLEKPHLKKMAHSASNEKAILISKVMARLGKLETPENTNYIVSEDNVRKIIQMEKELSEG